MFRLFDVVCLVLETRLKTLKTDHDGSRSPVRIQLRGIPLLCCPSLLADNNLGTDRMCRATVTDSLGYHVSPSPQDLVPAARGARETKVFRLLLLLYVRVPQPHRICPRRPFTVIYGVYTQMDSGRGSLLLQQCINIINTGLSCFANGASQTPQTVSSKDGGLGFVPNLGTCLCTRSVCSSRARYFPSSQRCVAFVLCCKDSYLE